MTKLITIHIRDPDKPMIREYDPNNRDETLSYIKYAARSLGLADIPLEQLADAMRALAEKNFFEDATTKDAILEWADDIQHLLKTAGYDQERQ